MNQTDILLASFTAIEGAHFYSAFLPSVMTIKKFANDEEALQSLRQGEVLASAFALGLGVIVSLLIQQPLPIIFAAGTIVLMLSVYEAAIAGTLNGKLV